MISIGKTVQLAVLTITATLVSLELLSVVQGKSFASAQTASIHSISGKGRVRVQREKRTDWTPARQGTELRQGDQILPDRGVRIRVRCPNTQQPVLVKAGVPSGLGSICIKWATRDARGSQAAETLGGVNSSIPYLISPRHSLLLSNTPTIRWNSVINAAEYTVEVMSPTGLIWKVQTKNNQIVYAGKPLQAGVPYSVTVRTNTGKSSQDDRAPNREQPASNLEFRILRPSEAATIKAEATELSPNNEADALDLARLYSNFVLPESVIQNYQLSADTYQTYSLTGDAIELLESLVRQGKQSPIVYRNLGDLYWQIGLVTPAEANYLKAIKQVKGLEDLEDWTLAHHSLAKVYAAIDNSKQTLQHYRQAKVGYIFLGDQGLADDLDRRIERLEKATANLLTTDN
jgi:hypothetical protein